MAQKKRLTTAEFAIVNRSFFNCKLLIYHHVWRSFHVFSHAI